MTFDATNLNGAHPRIALGAPASGTAGVDLSQKRVGPAIGAPFVFVWFPPSPATARQACISRFTILPS